MTISSLPIQIFKQHAPRFLVTGASNFASILRRPRTLQTFQPAISQEFIDHYANTSHFALKRLSAISDLKKMKLLSLGCHMSSLADFSALFDRVYHCTTLDTFMPVSGQDGASILQGDFFETPELDVDCFVSQASIHCLSDSRYQNTQPEDAWARPYQVAAKLNEIVPDRPLSVIVSIAVGYREAFIDNNAHLAHEKFVASFQQAEFTLQEQFFDHLSHAIDHKEHYLTPEYRRAPKLPPESELASEWSFVIGNYFFTNKHSGPAN